MSRQYRVTILEQVAIARHTMRLRLASPEIAANHAPGQFVMVRIADRVDPLIGRALAIYDRHRLNTPHWQAFDLVYVVKGKFTQALARMQAGQALDVVGPLGNSFCDAPVDHLIMVAGGVGETPMLSYAREALGESFVEGRQSGYAQRVTLCYGARSADLLAGLDDFANAKVDLQVSTDDGSRGKKQLVTQSLCDVLDTQVGSCRVACCGPEPMMQAVAKICLDRSIPCQVSLETPMACGIGICFTCVAKVRDGASCSTQPVQESGGEVGANLSAWDYRRTCVEGPIFDAATIVWG